MVRYAGLVLGGMLLAVPVTAQHASAAGPGREQVRLRILDQCVLTQSGKLPEQGAGPKCNCYAGRIVKAMTDEEVARFRKTLPRRLAGEASQILATCK